MDIKKLIAYIMGISIVGIIFIACLGYFFNFELFGEKGVFNIIGSTSVSSEFATPESDSDIIISDVASSGSPEILYHEQVYQVGDYIEVKNMISVKLPGSSEYISGADENGFSVSIQKIMDDSGFVIASASFDEAQNSEEIIAPVYYDAGAGIVQFHESGVFRIEIKVVGSYGRSAVVELRIPVEVN